MQPMPQGMGKEEDEEQPPKGRKKGIIYSAHF